MSCQAASCGCSAASLEDHNGAALCLWQKSLLLTEAMVNNKNKCSMLDELECCALFCVL